MLPDMGASSSSGWVVISMATPPSWLDAFRLMETLLLSDSRALTLNSVASNAGSTAMLWEEGSLALPSCSDQVQSSSGSH